MHSIKSFTKNYLVFITIIAGTIFQFVFLFLHNINWLLLNTIPDDSFYYFHVARNIVNGFGSTFDGVNLANGYHPLWMLVILPIFKIFSDGSTLDIVPIYMSLTVAIFFSCLTAVVLYKILKKYTSNNFIISLALFSWLFNPFVIYNILNGLETSLLLMLLSIFILQLINLSENVSRGNLIRFGLVGGLLSLARLDMVIVVAMANLYFLVRWQKEGIKYFLTSAMASAAVFVPWAIYNFYTFHMWLTSASLTSTFVNHRLTYNDNGGYSIFLFLKTIVYMLDRAFEQIFNQTGAPYLVLPLLGLALYFYVKEIKREDFDFSFLKNLRPEFYIAVGLLALLFVSAGLRWTFRSWYFIPQLMMFTLVITYALDRLSREFESTKYFIFILLLSFSFFFYIAYQKSLKDMQVLQISMYDAAVWQNENLPEGSHIGVFNSGIPAYFSKHKVTNVDGLINNNAGDAMRNNTLWNYISEVERVDYISDFDSYMTYRYKDSFGISTDELFSRLEKIHTIPGSKDLNIYRVKY